MRRYFLTEDKYLAVDRFLFNVKIDNRFISPDMEKIKNQYWSYVITTNSHFEGKVLPYDFDKFYEIVSTLLREQGDTYHTESHIRDSYRAWDASLPEFLSELYKRQVF